MPGAQTGHSSTGLSGSRMSKVRRQHDIVLDEGLFLGRSASLPLSHCECFILVTPALPNWPLANTIITLEIRGSL